jgi:hypothetical protein
MTISAPLKQALRILTHCHVQVHDCNTLVKDLVGLIPQRPYLWLYTGTVEGASRLQSGWEPNESWNPTGSVPVGAALQHVLQHVLQRSFPSPVEYLVLPHGDILMSDPKVAGDVASFVSYMHHNEKVMVRIISCGHGKLPNHPILEQAFEHVDERSAQQHLVTSRLKAVSNRPLLSSPPDADVELALNGMSPIQADRAIFYSIVRNRKDENSVRITAECILEYRQTRGF